MEKSSEIAKKNKKKYDGKYYNSSFATILRGFLKKKEFNQQQLAKKLNVSRQTISLYANGNSLPDIETFKKIIEYFKKNKYDYSSDYWLGLIDEPSSNVKMKAVNRKYGLSEKALDSLQKLNNFEKKEMGNTLKRFGVSTMDTINTLLEDTSLIKLIDAYFNASINPKYTLGFLHHGEIALYDDTKDNIKMGHTFIKGELIEKTILLAIENTLINVKEQIKKEGEKE